MILDVNSLLDSNHVLTVTAPSQGVYDTAGYGVNVPLPASVITGLAGSPPAAAPFGQDLGEGGPLASGPQLAAIIGATFTAAGAATLQAQLQAAVDSGNGVPGTWDTILETDTIAVALLIAGRKLCDFTVPHRYLGQNFPRFYRLNYVIATGPMTAGSIVYAGLLTGIDNNPLTPANY